MSCNRAGMLQIGVALLHRAQRSPTALAVASSAVLILHAEAGHEQAWDITPVQNWSENQTACIFLPGAKPARSSV